MVDTMWLKTLKLLGLAEEERKKKKKKVLQPPCKFDVDGKCVYPSQIMGGTCVLRLDYGDGLCTGYAPKPPREQPPKPDKAPPSEIITTMAWLASDKNNGFSGAVITLLEQKKFWRFDQDSWTWVAEKAGRTLIWSDVREIVPNLVDADAVIDALEADAEKMRMHHARFIERTSKYDDDTFHYIDRDGNVRYCDGSGTARVVWPR